MLVEMQCLEYKCDALKLILFQLFPRGYTLLVVEAVDIDRYFQDIAYIQRGNIA